MPRRGENIHKRKDGRWEGRYIKSYSIEGKAMYKSVYGATYTAVKEKLKLYNTTSIKEITPCNMSMERLCAEWLGDIQIRLKQSSYANYYNIVHNHILPYFKKIKVNMLNNILVTGFIKHMLTSGRIDKKGGLSDKTAHDIVLVLFQIIKYAEKNKYLSNFDYDITMPKVQVNELPVLSISEQNQLNHYRLKAVG